jgi:DNA-binding response OmpR family regulator
MHAVPAHRDARVGHPGRRHPHSSASRDAATRPRILLIDSGSTPMRRLTRRLTERGFSVAAESWHRGVDVSCVEECDVLVLDFDSADEDAPSTVRAIRAVRASLPTIVLDRGDPTHAARVLNSGADDYMPKPYRFDELRARIEVLLRTAAPHPSDVTE